jgi:regulation of enolase protein 1 (concanavalin A-like superfamily)
MLRTKIPGALAFLLAVIVLGMGANFPLGIAPNQEGALKLMAAPVPKAKAADRFRFLAFEGFDGKFGLNWKPVRHDPTHISLTKNRGKLTITTQRGTIHADANARGEPSAQNLFLLDNPLAADIDFVMTTCISSFTPTVAYQQAGLLCYDDDDNYAKFSYEFDWSKGEGQRFMLVLETAAKPEHFSVETEPGLKQVWLRLTKRGKNYEYSTSTDGKQFTIHGTKEWGDGAPKKLGILAKNGGPDGVPEVDACFDFFELRSTGGE